MTQIETSISLSKGRRSDGTLNRGLVYVAHQTWTVKIPTSLRKRICDCRLIQIPCKQEKEKINNDERSTGAAGGHRDPHIEFSRKGAIK